MGTNYYLIKNFCHSCNRGDKIHLGKLSHGWVFSLQYNNGEYYKSWPEMKRWLKKELKKGGFIVDEEEKPTHDSGIDLQVFMNRVEDSYADKGNIRETYGSFGGNQKLWIGGYKFNNYEFS